MYRSLRDIVDDLDKNKMLLRISKEVDPNLEAAEIHRQVYAKNGPAILFENIKGSKFQALSNLYGTIERTNYLFRKSLPKIKKVIELKADPSLFFKNPLRYLSAPFTALNALPLKSRFGIDSMYSETTIDQLPLIKSWPDDGGAFITLPQVFTLPPGSKNLMESNLGMYRIQLTGNKYETNKEIGLHYQLHRGIGVHHELYNRSDEEFKVSIFVGGLHSHAFSAIMPMPEGLSELTFAGMLANRRFRYGWSENGHLISSDADFVITGTIIKNKTLPEGPFGDHLGYYSLTHDFPVLKVDKVYHRKDPIWHFTVVGRPPQEDSSFGYLIHQLVKNLAAQEFPGLEDIHAVDAAGVHPLLLAVGKERYMPFRDPKPEEILTIANRILGSGQTSLAKYLFIAGKSPDHPIDTHDIPNFFSYILERIDLSRDLHFQTNTTIDTLDYSGDSWNGGSKLVVAAYGDKIRTLSSSISQELIKSIDLESISFISEGILSISLSPFINYDQAEKEITELANNLKGIPEINGFPMIVISDDAEFTAENITNFVWVTFTRSNPAFDVYGIDSFTKHKHWGCETSFIIDARIKPHHAPVLIEDMAIKKQVETRLDI